MIEILIWVFLGIAIVFSIATIILLLIMCFGSIIGIGKLDDFYYTIITPCDMSHEKDTETTFIDDGNISEN